MLPSQTASKPAAVVSKGAVTVAANAPDAVAVAVASLVEDMRQAVAAGVASLCSSSNLLLNQSKPEDLPAQDGALSLADSSSVLRHIAELGPEALPAPDGWPSLAEQSLALGAAPLRPGAAGKCWFQSQEPFHQDIVIFEKMGGTVGKCEPKFPQRLPLPGISEMATLCDCVAPVDATAFGLHFLEIGANDGVFLSNLAFFELQMGWRGLCIEGSPTTFRALKRHRPDCINVNGVVAPSGDVAIFYTYSNPSPNTWESAMSFMEGSKQCPDRAAAERLATQLPPGTTMEVHDVGVYRLSDLFRELGWTTFGWMSVDVEGAEDLIFDTIDFGAVHARYIMFEGVHPKTVSRLEVEGYTLAHNVAQDYIYEATPKAWKPEVQ